MNTTTRKLQAAAKQLADDVDAIEFQPPVTHVYNPLRYAWKAHANYLQFANNGVSANNGVRTLLLGMNPGPWGMAQTGVPFGEIAAVRDWMGIETKVDRPATEHPKRPVEGFGCERSEVSGRRLWGLFSERFPDPADFFTDHFVTNYCPLVFMEQSARNRTPDKLPTHERDQLVAACDRHLVRVIEILQPAHLVGVGTYAEKCLVRCAAKIDGSGSISRILHPSPASPAANRDWAGTAEKQLTESGIW